MVDKEWKKNIKYLLLHFSTVKDDLHILHILFSHAISINPAIHAEYAKCGKIKEIILIIFNVLKGFILLRYIIKSFKEKNPTFMNIPVNKLTT